jgi:coenzyme F420-reducing hydrogenase delta subunit
MADDESFLNFEIKVVRQAISESDGLLVSFCRIKRCFQRGRIEVREREKKVRDCRSEILLSLGVLQLRSPTATSTSAISFLFLAPRP